MARLLGNQDFRTVLAYLEEERDQMVEELLTERNSVTVHQLQGCSLTLVKLLRTVMSAPDALRQAQLAQQQS